MSVFDDTPIPLLQALGMHEALRRLRIPADEIFLNVTGSDLTVVLPFRGLGFPIAPSALPEAEIARRWQEAVTLWNAASTPEEDRKAVFIAFVAAIDMARFTLIVTASRRLTLAIDE